MTRPIYRGHRGVGGYGYCVDCNYKPGQAGFLPTCPAYRTRQGFGAVNGRVYA